jgi:hypothetical protein
MRQPNKAKAAGTLQVRPGFVTAKRGSGRKYTPGAHVVRREKPFKAGAGLKDVTTSDPSISAKMPNNGQQMPFPGTRRHGNLPVN